MDGSSSSSSSSGASRENSDTELVKNEESRDFSFQYANSRYEYNSFLDDHNDNSLPAKLSSCGHFSDDDSYIEIALESIPNITCQEFNGRDEEEHYSLCQEECDLRISFSNSSNLATLPRISSSPQTLTKEAASLIAVSTSKENNAAISATKSTAMTSNKYIDDNSSCCTIVGDHTNIRHHNKKWRRVNLPAANRILNAFSFSLREPCTSESGSMRRKMGVPMINCLADTNNDSLHLVDRRGPKAMKRASNGGISNCMKLFFKFRVIKVQALLASLVKKSKKLKPPKGEESHNNINSMIDHEYCYSNNYKNWGKDQSKRYNYVFKDSPPTPTYKSCKRSSGRLVEYYCCPKIDYMNNYMDANLSSVVSNGKMEKYRSQNKRSCPTTCMSSPIHEGFPLHHMRENSIQAAIAHCKTSFGHSSDFSFPNF